MENEECDCIFYTDGFGNFYFCVAKIFIKSNSFLYNKEYTFFKSLLSPKNKKYLKGLRKGDKYNELVFYYDKRIENYVDKIIKNFSCFLSQTNIEYKLRLRDDERL